MASGKTRLTGPCSRSPGKTSFANLPAGAVLLEYVFYNKHLGGQWRMERLVRCRSTQPWA